MTKPYSTDLRVRVVEAVDEGATRQEAAERFGVMTRLFGRAPRGERVIGRVPFSAWKTVTFVAALRHDG
jgi:transposase